MFHNPVALWVTSFARTYTRDYKAWCTVPLIVLLALGETVFLGAIAFCMLRGQSLDILVDRGGGRYGVKCV
ncbi:MAG: hypothetical protein Q4D79_14915 [Propionibacteriaceae bacterium]|nr:hypothetical protein [Propionibacteriaceae bacterium]